MSTTPSGLNVPNIANIPLGECGPAGAQPASAAAL